MNKDIVKKYKKEFEHWLSGNSVLIFDNNKWVEISQNTNLWEISHNTARFIINDEYVEFRKAMADDKIIEANKMECPENPVWQEIRADKEEILRCYLPSLLRVKPEEHIFKIGDWVIDVSPEDSGIHQIINQEMLNQAKKDISFECWKPKPDEWCWFYDDDEIPELRLFISMEEKDDFCAYKVYDTSFNDITTCYIHCDPFFGTLPTSIKKREITLSILTYN